MTKQQVGAKVSHLSKTVPVSAKKEIFEKDLQNFFDVTMVDSDWPHKEHQELCKMQIEGLIAKCKVKNCI